MSQNPIKSYKELPLHEAAFTSFGDRGCGVPWGDRNYWTETDPSAWYYPGSVKLGDTPRHRIKSKGAGANANKGAEEYYDADKYNYRDTTVYPSWWERYKNFEDFSWKSYKKKDWTYTIPCCPAFAEGDSTSVADGIVLEPNGYKLEWSLPEGWPDNPSITPNFKEYWRGSWYSTRGWDTVTESTSSRTVYTKELKTTGAEGEEGRVQVLVNPVGEVTLSGEITIGYLQSVANNWIGDVVAFEDIAWNSDTGSGKFSCGTTESAHYHTGGSSSEALCFESALNEVTYGWSAYWDRHKWEAPFKASVCILTRKNSPLAYGAEAAFGAYVRGFDSIDLQSKITEKIWKDDIGIYDRELSALDEAAWTGLEEVPPGWPIKGLEDLKDLLPPTADSRDGGWVGSGMFRSTSSAVYRITLEVLRLTDDYWATVGDSKVLVVNREDGIEVTYGVYPGGDEGWNIGTDEPVISKVEKQGADGGWVDIPFEGGISAEDLANGRVPNAFGKLVGHDPCSDLISFVARWREGSRWGHPRFVVSGETPSSDYYRKKLTTKKLTP